MKKKQREEKTKHRLEGSQAWKEIVGLMRESKNVPKRNGPSQLLAPCDERITKQYHNNQHIKCSRLVKTVHFFQSCIEGIFGRTHVIESFEGRSVAVSRYYFSGAIHSHRVVSFEQGEQKAKEFGMEFVETSAKTGFNIKSLFHKVVAQLGIQNTLPTNTPDGNLINSRTQKLLLCHYLLLNPRLTVFLNDSCYNA
jgi:hypothetical protein